MTKVVNNRVNFASVHNPYPFPDFLDVQLKSFRDFLQLDTPPEERKNDGLYKVFAENFPITDTRNNFVLEFLDYYIDPPRYSIDECLERGLTYSVPLKAKMKLYCTDPDHEDFGTFIQDVFLGTIPYMTDNGTFVINGAERVVVAQLHRSPGVFFGQGVHANGTVLYSARIIPFKGSWIEFATDINNVMYAYIDRKKKLPVTTMLRAIGYESDKDILKIFDLAEEVKVNKKNLKACLGRKLAGNVMKTSYEEFTDEDTGEVTLMQRNQVILDRGTEITEDNYDLILDSEVQTILLHKDEETANKFSIIFNTLAKDPSNSETEAVRYIYRQLRNADPVDDTSAREVFQNLFFSDKRYDLGEVGRYRINTKLGLDTDGDVRVLTKEDIIAIIKYLIKLINSNASVDDIDHLSNRRVRTVGEQLANQFSIGLARMSRTIRERMNVRDNEVFTPTDLINAKTISSVISVLKLFGLTAVSTGNNEKAAQAAGITYDKVVLFPASHATYYPGAQSMAMKVLYEKESLRLLGAQIVGGDGVDKRIDVLATAIRATMTALELTELDLPYAPPYSSAKDPVNMAGFMIENLESEKVQQFHWNEVEDLPCDGSATLLDVRTAWEYQRGHLAGFRNIPLDDLREHLDELDRGKPVYVNCQTGLRSYLACRLLTQYGFSCAHLSGGRMAR